MRRGSIPLLVLLFLFGLPLSAQAPFADELLAELNRARAERGLGALESDPRLAAIATRRAQAMASEGWFGLKSPAGRVVEDELDADGYRFRLVTEKLTRSTAGAAALMDEWRLRASEQQQSLFHRDVTQVGVGTADSAAGRIVDVVLATPMDGAGGQVIAAKSVSGTPSNEIDAPAELKALAKLVGEARREANLRSVRVDALVAQAAQEHAEALLEAMSHGQGPEAIELFADRLTRIEQNRQVSGAGIARSQDAFSGRMINAAPSGKPLHDLVATAIVTGARSADEALATFDSAESRPPYFEPALAGLGVGLAVDRSKPDGQTVWVVATRRP